MKDSRWCQMEKAGLQDRVKLVGSGGKGAPEAAIDTVWPPRLPPWGRPSAWEAVTATLDHHLGLAHIHGHGPAQRKSAAIGRLMAHMDPQMAALARRTCPDCADPCCRRATVWYDCTDLLVLGFTGQPWPPGQPMAAVGDRCRYLGPAGCRLPRIQRPWICTWYLCPRQTACLQRSMRSQRARLASWLRGMRSLRRGLLDAFIGAALA